MEYLTPLHLFIPTSIPDDSPLSEFVYSNVYIMTLFALIQLLCSTAVFSISHATNWYPWSLYNKEIPEPELLLQPKIQAYDTVFEAFKQAQNLKTRVRNKISRRGLSGFVNGSRKSALADTGAKDNFMSADYAKEAGLDVEVSPSPIKIGNSKKLQSIGRAKMLWAFAENPTRTFEIICHVLPHCTYDLILGVGFLTATETMSKYRRRVTECIFSVFNVFPFNFVGNNYQFLEGILGDTQRVFASPDTGAERNVMDMQYAVDCGFEIHNGREHCNYLQFADGSCQETVGQVVTHWTFASGERIPVTFEVLENCCSNVILGEDFLWDYNVFEDHASSITTLSLEGDSIALAPFSFRRKWQQGLDKILTKIKHKTNSNNNPRLNSDIEILQARERHRRDLWNHNYGFGGSNTTAAELEIENNRRREYDAEILRIEALSNSGNILVNNMPLVPSIPTSPNRRSNQRPYQPP